MSLHPVHPPIQDEGQAIEAVPQAYAVCLTSSVDSSSALADCLSRQFSLTFGFRPPYQVLGKSLSASRSISATDYCFPVDAQMIQDSEAWKMDLVSGFERTLGDKVKPSA